MTSLRATLTTAALLALVPTGAASAQTANNTISILQQGERNTLTVDQSNATGSTVGGLTLLGRGTASGLSVDGRGTQIFRSVEIDEATLGDDEDTLSRRVVQEAVEGSAEVRGVSFNATNPGPAVQRGSGNRADVTIRGVGGNVGLLQQNELNELGNVATVDLTGRGTALIGQLGANNDADIRMTGDGALGAIVQEGSGNDATLIVDGNGRRGSISQIGDRNVSVLNVSSFGPTTTSVDLIVQGSGLQTPSGGVSVITNAPSVTITQTSLTP